ncbi:MAG TPA: DsbA family protein [Gemmatimonadales bacterium]|nr:DsbA family protein [Gemmatimonadales bacterium]
MGRLSLPQASAAVVLLALLVSSCADRALATRLTRMERRVDSLAVTVTAMNAYIQRYGLASGGGAKPESVTVDAIGETLGSAKAPVTIVEFTDFQCPFCGRHATETFPLIRQKYISTGQVRYILRDFPLSAIHPFALPAAKAARCAGAQGAEKFWAFHDSLFAHQKDLSDLYLSTLARQTGLYAGAFKACTASGKYDAAIATDAAAASKAGFDGTPGFVVGRTRPDGKVTGLAIRGAYPIDRFDVAIAGAARPRTTAPPRSIPSSRSVR